VHTRKLLNRAFLALGALMVIFSLVAIPLGGSESSGSSSGSGPEKAGPAKKTNEVAIKDFKFEPKEVTVAAGTKLTWTNEDTAPHTATASDGQDVFTTDTVEKGQSESVTLEKPGTYEYFCQFHAYMQGTVTVE